MAYFVRAVCAWGILVGVLTAIGLSGVRATTYLTRGETRGTALIQGPMVWEWTHPSARFGGISAILIDDGGTSFIAASDRGTLFEGVISRSGLSIESVTVNREVPIRPPTDKEPENEFLTDLEGLSRMKDGSIALSYEGYARIRVRPTIDGPSIAKHHWSAFQEYFGNGAFESIATLPDGQLIFILERPENPKQATAFTLDGTDLSAPFPLPRTNGYVHTGSDLGPDGCLYALERSFSVGAGFRFRLSRLWPADGDWLAADDWVSELLFESPQARMGNAEGVSVWRAGSKMTVSVVTDNGFLPASPTRIIEFDIEPGHCKPQS